MFNSVLKKDALKELEQEKKEYNKECEVVIKQSAILYEKKDEGATVLGYVERYISTLKNKPIEIEKKASEVSFKRKSFENEVENLKRESENTDNTEKGIIGGGILAGAGVAAFGPTAAMGIATTFGTASTGTAIATLAGAAQTNAALAWLGGGAVFSGGAGMAGGQALLAMAGPVGWAIGGAALVGGGLLASSKNKKIAEQAEKQRNQICSARNDVKKIIVRIKHEIDAISPLNKKVAYSLISFKQNGKQDYRLFTETEKCDLMKLMNSAQSLAAIIGAKIS